MSDHEDPQPEQVLPHRINGRYLLDVGLRFAAVLVVPVVLFLFTLNSRVSHIEANRFTNSQGARLEGRVSNAEEKLKLLPPVWMREDIADLKAEIGKLRTELKEHIHRMEGRRDR